jgi:hypothetical protein
MTTTRKRRRTSSRLAVWLVLLGVSGPCALVLYGVLNDRANAGAGLPEFSVYANDRNGLAQAGMLLRKLGWRPIALTRPVQQAHLRGLLIIVLPSQPSAFLRLRPLLYSDDVRGLVRWIEQGNTLLLCGSDSTELHAKLGLILNEGPPTDSIHRATPGAVGEFTAGVQRIGLESLATVSGRRAVPLWWLRDKPAAVAIRHGKGRVLVIPDPSLLTHRGLLREDNAVFLYNVAATSAADGCVYFDEYHHGIAASAGFWSYLRYHGQQGIVLHLLLVGTIGVWAVGRRLGPAIPLPADKQADGVAYASSVARIYQKASVRPVVAGIYARHFVEAITGRLALRRGAPAKEILAVWRRRHGNDSAELEHLLAGAEEFRAGRVQTSRLLLATVQEFDGFMNRHFRRAARRQGSGASE